MNLPNKLTIVRILLLPVLLGLYLLNESPESLNTLTYIFVGIFVFASLTDFFDGYYARKYNVVTTFGKFLDPLADKLLVLLALLILQEMEIVPLWTVFLIVSREFLVTGIRLLAVNTGKVISASQLGKAKTFVTLIGMTLIFLTIVDIGLVIYYIALFLTVVSGIEYLLKNIHLIDHQK
jgi:CDP-diacylglycerol--glycerol-3-phosphate 3-phosphatidyltransferase